MIHMLCRDIRKPLHTVSNNCTRPIFIQFRDENTERSTWICSNSIVSSGCRSGWGRGEKNCPSSGAYSLQPSARFQREKGFHPWPHVGSLSPKNCLWRSVAEGFLDLFYAPLRQEIVCKEIVESSSLKQCFNHLSRNQFSPVPGNKFRPKGVEKPNPDVGENLVAATALSLYLQLIEPDITTLKVICYTVGCKLGQIGSTFQRQ